MTCYTGVLMSRQVTNEVPHIVYTILALRLNVNPHNLLRDVALIRIHSTERIHLLYELEITCYFSKIIRF